MITETAPTSVAVNKKPPTPTSVWVFRLIVIAALVLWFRHALIVDAEAQRDLERYMR